ncbi:MAG: HD domain-containing protein [Methanomicrobiales archaeon]|nr:HD domain-containing protein [Methanomicrobiales archaeon]
MTDSFIGNWNISVTEDEKYLLYLAAWLHDIGCISDREHHNIASFQILLQDEGTCNSINYVNPSALMQLKYVINSHSSSYNIDSVPETMNGVRLKLICSIFRLLDACEICCTKCPKAVFKVIAPTLKDDPAAYSYWDGHMRIQSVVYKDPDILILARDSNQNSVNIVDRLRKEVDSITSIFLENGLHIPNIVVIDDSFVY